MLMLSANNLLRPQDGKPVTVPTQDMILGAYYLTYTRLGKAEKGAETVFVTDPGDTDFPVNEIVDADEFVAANKAAKAAGVKSVAMIHVADINKVTGYIRGGCSPVGMKKQFVTVYDESCLAQPTIMVSGGRIGTQVECAPADLIKVTRGKTAAITQEHQA